MTTIIRSSVVRTCLGDGAETFAALLEGKDGRVPLGTVDPALLRVAYGYRIDDPGAYAPSRWLAACVAEAVSAAGVDPTRARVACLVGTGLRELASLEDAGDPADVPAHRMHFADAVRSAVPGIGEVLTFANACSAGGHALALAQDMLEAGEVDAVVVAAADTMTTSMLAMIGRVAERPTERVRPFDANRQGVLLGDGAAAVVLTGSSGATGGLARLLATGLSCDAHHETAPDVHGIVEAMRDGLTRAGLRADQVGTVIAHGTGTDLNDPVEAAALRDVLVAGGGNPLVTGIKGAIGHTSGTAALANLDVALRSLASGRVPPVVGLRTPLPEASGLRLVRDVPAPLPDGAIQVDAFGFGGVNAVTLLAAL